MGRSLRPGYPARSRRPDATRGPRRALSFDSVRRPVVQAFLATRRRRRLAGALRAAALRRFAGGFLAAFLRRFAGAFAWLPAFDASPEPCAWLGLLPTLRRSLALGGCLALRRSLRFDCLLPRLAGALRFAGCLAPWPEPCASLVPSSRRLRRFACRRLPGGLPRRPTLGRLTRRRLLSLVFRARSSLCRRHGHHLSRGMFGGRRSAPGLLVHGGLEGCSRRELHALRRRDLYRLAGARVATRARRAR